MPSLDSESSKNPLEQTEPCRGLFEVVFDHRSLELRDSLPELEPVLLALLDLHFHFSQLHMQVPKSKRHQHNSQSLLAEFLAHCVDKLLHGYFFLAVFAEARKAAAVGAPLLPGLRIFSLLPAAMRSRLALMLA